MDIYFLTNGAMNTYRAAERLQTSRDMQLDEYVELFNPFIFRQQFGQQVGGDDEGGDDEEAGGLKYYTKLFLKIFAWIIFWCFFGPLGPWILLTWYTFKRLIFGYKVYFRQY